MLRFTKQGRHWGILVISGYWDGFNYHQITPSSPLGRELKMLAKKYKTYTVFQYWED